LLLSNARFGRLAFGDFLECLSEIIRRKITGQITQLLESTRALLDYPGNKFSAFLCRLIR
jgi:hypothetical protein